MKKKILFFILLLSVVNMVFAKEIKIDNIVNQDATVHGELLSFDHIYYEAIVVLDNGDYVVGGTEAIRSVIAKYNSNGELIWKTTSDEVFTNIESIAITEDEGFLVTGLYQDAPIRYVGKYDKNGNYLWGKTYGPNANGSIYTRVLSLKNGNYLLSGQACKYNFDDSGYTDECHANLMIIDGEGNTLKEKVFDNAGSIDNTLITSDNNILFIYGGKITKMNYELEKIWSKDFLQYTDAYDIAETDDGFIIAARKNNYPILVKYDKEGKLIKESNYLIEKNSLITSVVDGSGKYIAVGYVSGSTLGDKESILLVVNKDFSIDYQKTSPQDIGTAYYRIAKVKEGDYVVSGMISDKALDSSDDNYDKKANGVIDKLTINYDVEVKKPTNGKVSFVVENGKGKIEIKPDEGYILATILVLDSNGNPLELTGNDLIYYFSLVDDVTIEVEYKKIEINPNTKTFIGLAFIILIISSICCYIFYRNKKRLE